MEQKKGIVSVISIIAMLGGGFSAIASPLADNFLVSEKTVQSVPEVPTTHPIFKPIIPNLQKKTKVPILLPSYIPESEATNPLYAQLGTMTAGKYSILLAFDPQCNEATACRLGSVSGEVITSKNKAIKGKIITLSRQRKGYFVDATCGANCSDSTLDWQEKGYRYRVAIKAGDLKTLHKMANSTVLIPLEK
jgi:hypothetical protein